MQWQKELKRMKDSNPRKSIAKKIWHLSEANGMAEYISQVRRWID